MKIKAEKEMDRKCVFDWLNAVYRNPRLVFITYSDKDLMEFAHDTLVLMKEQEDALEQMGIDNEDLRKCYTELLKEQEAKTGHWIDTTKVFGFPRVQCSACGSEQGAVWMYYCPICGAKMEGR